MGEMLAYVYSLFLIAAEGLDYSGCNTFVMPSLCLLHSKPALKVCFH